MRTTPTRPPCCYASAVEPDTGYCAECGAPLLRCAAFEECGGLLDEDGLCHVCVAPALLLQPVEDARVGGAVALPLELRNTSTVGRPLFVRGLWVREDTEWSPVELAWDRLDAGATAPLAVTARALDRAGVHRVEVLLAVSSRWRWREETVAFTSGVELRIDEETRVSVQQNIHYAADAPQTGATIYAPVRVESEAARRPDARRSGAQVLPLVRAQRLERTLGLRGQVGQPAVPRAARLAWRGFAPGLAPADGPIVTVDGTLALGRARTRAQGGSNDVRLLAHGRGGAVDEECSRGVSRQHFTLWIENGRALVRCESENGAWLDGQVLARGEARALADGISFSPLVREPQRLLLRTTFASHHDVVDTVTLTRVPENA